MFKKLLSFLNLANNSLPKDNSSNIEIQQDLINVEKPPIIENLGVKLFPKIQNIKTKEKFDVPQILNNCSKNNYKKLESWLFYDYLRNFDSLTEAKYKAITLSVLLNNKGINIEIMPSIKDMVETISNALFSQQEINVKVEEMFFSSKIGYDEIFNPLRLKYAKGHIGSEHGILKPFYEIIEEDSNSEDKINVARKIWSDFSGAGLLAYALKDFSVNAECFANLQDFKLYDSDLNKFEEATNQQKSNNDILPPSLYSITEHPQVWSKLIDNEDSIDNLNIVKNLAIAASLRKYDVLNFLNNQGLSFPDNDKNEDVVLKHVSSRIKYLEMESELSVEPIDKPKAKKLKI
jgi:hypothetical protein